MGADKEEARLAETKPAAPPQVLLAQTSMDMPPSDHRPPAAVDSHIAGDESDPAPLFSDHAIAFNRALLTFEERVPIALPAGHRLMNPFASGAALEISSDFYRRFYHDRQRRRMILGINPGRHGAGLTGVPFTDSKQLDRLGIDPHGIRSFEPSAAFVYRVVDALGGAAQFYRRFYINSPLPLGLLRQNDSGRMVNANYYDSAELRRATEPLITHTMDAYRHQFPLLDFSVGYCLGQGQNYRYLCQWNSEHHLFDTLIALPHPRYVMQYRFKHIDEHLADYAEKLGSGR